MTDDLVKRLRKADEYEPLGHDGWEAADLITALLAQIAALRAERDKWMERCGRERAFASSHLIRAEAAEAQIAALTARVEGLVNEAVLSKAAYEGVSSMLLSVQQDCIKERQRAKRLETALKWQAEQPEANPFMVAHALAALKEDNHE